MNDPVPEFGFGTQICGDLRAGSQREWLLADGQGGYAMGTITGLRTRRYHGLLVLAGDPPASRHLALASLDPVVRLASGAVVRLATHEWASGAVDPAGYALLERFDLTDGLPRWRWRVGPVVLERELAMVPGQPWLVAVHRLLASDGAPVELHVDALCTWRDAHGERTAAGPPPAVEPVAGGILVEGAYRLVGPGWEPTGQWWHGVHHREEAARGLAAQEDLWHAGRFTATLHRPGEVATVHAFATGARVEPTEHLTASGSGPRLVAAARDRVRGWDPLVRAADQFVITTTSGRPEVVAGYPWFGAWSRDTMISYPGLFLATGRVEQGRALLAAAGAALSEGMLPNTADTGRLEYNTADATLWFVHAVERHVTSTGDTDLAAELLPALEQVLGAHQRGTRFGIRVDPTTGLLWQGAEAEALTWMDARVDGAPVTARTGAAVELNALWANALAAVATLRTAAGAGEAERLWRAHAQAREAFGKAFRAPGGGLYDTLGDPAIRPNQVFAYALPYPPLEPDPAAIRAIGAVLLTPLGLRSLAPGEPGYRGVHRGDPAARDHAYHQGTVWPWLIGAYHDACRAAGVPVDGLLDGLMIHLGEWGLGSVSETADGDPPHPATGCPFQAWSVAELLRISPR